MTPDPPPTAARPAEVPPPPGRADQARPSSNSPQPDRATPRAPERNSGSRLSHRGDVVRARRRPFHPKEADQHLEQSPRRKRAGRCARPSPHPEPVASRATRRDHRSHTSASDKEPLAPKGTLLRNNAVSTPTRPVSGREHTGTGQRSAAGATTGWRWTHRPSGAPTRSQRVRRPRRT